ncbi:hypothetical protein RUM43_013140 [Polyplax serrata]|uniref:Dynein attachment factor N-terminal domain-containing protein n=1 Tax=Polyplax serrata TaxID=468196 RepID=A0AAN8NRK7_POLSC
MIDFNILEGELENAIMLDENYKRENNAKFRAVEQRVATYDEFRDIVKASHLRPLDKNEKIADPKISQKNVIWNVAASKTEGEMLFFNESKRSKKHFTEK